jgi:hypothetical protein
VNLAREGPAEHSRNHAVPHALSIYSHLHAKLAS